MIAKTFDNSTEERIVYLVVYPMKIMLALDNTCTSFHKELDKDIGIGLS